MAQSRSEHSNVSSFVKLDIHVRVYVGLELRFTHVAGIATRSQVRLEFK